MMSRFVTRNFPPNDTHKIIVHYGGRKALSQIIGVSPQAVGQWVRIGLPPARLLQIYQIAKATSEQDVLDIIYANGWQKALEIAVAEGLDEPAF